MENRHGLVVEAELTRAAGFAERRATVELVAAQAGGGPITVGADRAYDAAGFVMELRELGATPHVAAEQCAPALGDRPPHHPPSRLPAQPAGTPSHRGGIRLGQDHRRPEQDQVSRPRSGALALHPCHHGLQPDPPAQAAGGAVVSAVTWSNTARARPDNPLRHQRRPLPTSPIANQTGRITDFFNSLLV
jgi:hypothetical protein